MPHIEQIRLLDRVSQKGIVHVDATRIPKHISERKQAKQQQWITTHAPNGTVRPKYHWDASSGRIQCFPNLLLLSYEDFTPAEGNVLFDLRIPVEIVVHLQDAGHPGMVDLILQNRTDWWAALTEEMLTPYEKEQGIKPWRQALKIAVFRALYGARPDTPEEEAMLARVLHRWPNVLLKGTKDEKRALIVRRNLRATEVWLDIALEAEKQGCLVPGFWMSEPLLEVPATSDVDGMKAKLTDYGYGLLKA